MSSLLQSDGSFWLAKRDFFVFLFFFQILGEALNFSPKYVLLLSDSLQFYDVV